MSLLEFVGSGKLTTHRAATGDLGVSHVPGQDLPEQFELTMHTADLEMEEIEDRCCC